jgi:hypothetical protein
MNPGLWINIISLILGLIAVAVNDEWVKQNASVITILGMANFILTAALQYLRDVNKPQPIIEHIEEQKKIVSTINTVTKQEVDKPEVSEIKASEVKSEAK